MLELPFGNQIEVRSSFLNFVPVSFMSSTDILQDTTMDMPEIDTGTLSILGHPIGILHVLH